MSSCPMCGAPAKHLWNVGDRNRAITDEQFSYARCTACGVIHLENPPEDIGRYYPDSYYDLLRPAELERHAASEQYKVDLLLELGAAGKLTEIGPGQGVFSFAAVRAGYEVTGIEMDERACRHLEEYVGVTAINSDAPQDALAQLEPQGVIALWHVLEHLPDPWAFVTAAAAALEPGGILALSTPNPDSLGMRMLGKRWPHVDAPRHGFLVPSAALRDHAATVGLRQERFTTDDPGGRHWNRFGWEYALRGPDPSSRRARVTSAAGLAGTVAALPLERRPGQGAAYTVAFRKDGSP